MMCLIFFFCNPKRFGSKNYLEQVSTLDLVAVLGGGKLLHVLAVLVGHHDGGHGGQAGVEASIRGHGANITGNSLKTLLRLNNSLKKYFRFKSKNISNKYFAFTWYMSIILSTALTETSESSIASLFLLTLVRVT